MSFQKITAKTFQEKKLKGEKILMLTCYDYPTALIVDKTEIDSVLVGDSLGMVMLGYETTIPVTIEEIIHHAKAVSRGIKRAFVIADMPMGTYHVCIEDGIRNAIRLVKEASVEAVKIEGGKKRSLLVKKIVEAEIPVMGHIGLTPQSIHMIGGYKVQGKEKKSAEEIIEDALSLERAGAFAIVLECIPMNLAKEITAKLSIPTIGIGSGPYCDGQILVLHDMLGMWGKNNYKFVKKYANIYNIMLRAIKRYCKEVREGLFPSEKHSFANSKIDTK